MNTINEIREYLNITRNEFSRLYHIPVRTLEDWESGKRLPPAYLVELLEYAATTSGKAYKIAPLEHYDQTYINRHNKNREKSILAIEKKKVEKEKL